VCKKARPVITLFFHSACCGGSILYYGGRKGVHSEYFSDLFMLDTGVCQPRETAEQLAIHTAVHDILHKTLNITWTERILSTLRS